MQIHTVEIVLMDINSISRSRERILHPQFPEGKKHILLKKPNEYFTIKLLFIIKNTYFCYIPASISKKFSK